MARRPIHLRPFQPGDHLVFALRPDMAQEFARLDWPWAKRLPGPTWTLVRYPGEVIGFGGGHLVGPGAFQVYCFLADLPRGDWTMAIACARTALGRLEREHGGRTFTALLRVGHVAGERTLARLGFTRSAEASDWPGYRIMARGL